MKSILNYDDRKYGQHVLKFFERKLDEAKTIEDPENIQISVVYLTYKLFFDLHQNPLLHKLVSLSHSTHPILLTTLMIFFQHFPKLSPPLEKQQDSLSSSYLPLAYEAALAISFSSSVPHKLHRDYLEILTQVQTKPLIEAFTRINLDPS